MPRHHHAHVAQRPDRAQGEFILIVIIIVSPVLSCFALLGTVRQDKARSGWGF
jgi:hypothetical protein